MKKLLITSFAILATTVAGYSQATPIYREMSLLTGWNVYITNGTSIGPGTLGTPFTSKNGQILLALCTNVINGVSESNTPAPDAFVTDGVRLVPNANGDFVANAAIHILLNQTNLIPVALTNSAGQLFVGTTPTNAFPYQLAPPLYTPWPLVASQYPAYQYPATTNRYLGLPYVTSTNNLVFTFQRGWKYQLGLTKTYAVWDTSTNLFQFTYNGALVPGGAAWAVAGTPQTIVTNLPTSFTQGADLIRLASVSEPDGTGNEPSPYIINSMSVGQPQP